MNGQLRMYIFRRSKTAGKEETSLLDCHQYLRSGRVSIRAGSEGLTTFNPGCIFLRCSSNLSISTMSRSICLSNIASISSLVIYQLCLPVGKPSIGRTYREKYNFRWVFSGSTLTGILAGRGKNSVPNLSLTPV